MGEDDKQAPHQNQKAAENAAEKEQPADETEEALAAADAQEEADLVLLRQGLEKCKKATADGTKLMRQISRFYRWENWEDKEGRTALLHRIVRTKRRIAKQYVLAAKDYAEGNEPDEARSLQATAKLQRAEAEKFLIDGEIRIKAW